MSWRINGDIASVVVGGLGAIVMEILHPSVMAGVQDLSNYREEPERRGKTTFGYVVTTSFANTQAATRLINAVKKMHSQVNGTRPDGVPYRALDPELIGWVHTCIPWAIMTAYERYNEPLSEEEKDRYLTEQALIGRMGGAGEIPETARRPARLRGGDAAQAGRDRPDAPVLRVPDDDAVRCPSAGSAVAAHAPLPGGGGNEPDAGLGAADDRLRQPRDRTADGLRPVAGVLCAGDPVGVRDPGLPPAGGGTRRRSGWTAPSRLPEPFRRVSITGAVYTDMSKVRVHICVSADGYVAGPNQSKENPLGEGGESLHDWVVALKAWREAHGKEGGEVNASSAVLEEATANVGAEIMGRGKFGGGPGPWGERSLARMVGRGPAVPRAGLRAHPPRARAAHALGHDVHLRHRRDRVGPGAGKAGAAGKDVTIGGGADVINQYLAAGLVDELELHVVPLVLGGGARLFDGVGPEVRLEQVRVVDAPGVTHMKISGSACPSTALPRRAVIGVGVARRFWAHATPGAQNTRDTGRAMSQENVEVTERFIDAYNRRDVEAMLADLDPEIEWHSGITSLAREDGTFLGYEGFRAALRDVYEALGETHIECSEIRDLGDRIVTDGRFHVRGRESGAETMSPWAAVADFKGSKGIRIRSYFNVEEALEAAGLSEWAALARRGLRPFVAPLPNPLPTPMTQRRDRQPA